MKTTHTVATLAAALITYGSLAGGAHAATILDFGLSDIPSSPSYTESGFIFTHSSFNVNTGATPLSDGSALFANSPFSSPEFLILRQVSGQPFTLTSFDAYDQFGAGSASVTGIGGTSPSEVFSPSIEDYSTFVPTADFSGITELQIQGDWRYDNFVVSPVPEPSSAVLLGLGALGTALSRRRHK